MGSLIARAGVVLAGFTAAAVLVAPGANADYPRGSCLVVENDRATAVRITVNNNPFRGKTWTIDPHARWVITEGGQKITNPDRGWRISAPQGEWRYDANMFAGKGCNGSWIFRLS